MVCGKMRAPEDLAYCAALFDGEGNVRSTMSRNKWSLSETRIIRFAIKMTDLEPLQKFLTCVGRGKIYGPYREKSWPNYYRSQYTFLVQNFEDAQYIVALIWKWLSGPKRKQARTALKKFIALGYITNT